MRTKLTILFISFLLSFLIIRESKQNYVNLNLLHPVPGSFDNPDAAAKFRYDMIRGRDSIIDIASRRNAIKYIKTHFEQTKEVNWTSIGPGNIGGRIRSIVIRPSNPNHILIGAVAGGIWKSTDSGLTWAAKNEDGDPLAIASMVNNGDTVYAGTGESWGNTDAVCGGGIWKSTDFGESWTLLDSTENNWSFLNVLSMKIDPVGNIYAVTKATKYKDNGGSTSNDGGLFKSINGGNTWEKISKTYINNYNNACDVIPFSPDTIIFATKFYGIYRTMDGGASWGKITSGLPPGDFDRIAFAQDPNNSSIAYAVFSGSGDYGLRGIYKTTDYGENWTELNKPQGLQSTNNYPYIKTQGWYNNVISIDPFNSNNIYVGGVEDMKSTDGGNSWTQITYWHTYYGTPYVHADHHAIVFDPITPDVVYDGNDGGIWKTTDGGSSWVSLNNGLEITQFYGGAVDSNNVFMGGTQDNGHLKSNATGSFWNMVKGGDGGYAEIDQANSNIAYEEYTNLAFYKTTNGGNSWNYSVNGLYDAYTTNALFIAPFAMNPENSNVLLAGSKKVWFTENSAENWVASSSTLNSSAKVSAVTIVNATSPYLGFAGLTNGFIFKCTSLTGNSDNWENISPLFMNSAWVRRITVDPNDKNKIYACYSGYNNDGVTPTKHVFYSSDQGSNWTDISGNLPDAPVHSLVIDPYDSQRLYIGTEVGVFQTTDRGGTWTRLGGGIPDFVPVDELVIQKGTNKLFAFTHGRSAYVSNAPLPVELIRFNANLNENSVKLIWETATETNNYGFEILRNSENDDYEKIGFVKGYGTSNSPKEYSFTDNELLPGNYSYKLKQIDLDGGFKYSKIVNIKIIAPQKFDLMQNYPNPFNPSTTIQYVVPVKANVKLVVYDVAGREISTLVNTEQSPGNYTVKFIVNNLPSGVYFYTLRAGNFVSKKKMMLLK